ncbi:phosphatase PAP2 family protein [Candidatus Aminicenantes bacterium AC-334-K16]|jgi:membrane-associated phospholipid phosphatase|nr:phosphatase PAP2 family protein [Candidatus Aminicenantes bacterium AC-334-K16]
MSKRERIPAFFLIFWWSSWLFLQASPPRRVEEFHLNREYLRGAVQDLAEISRSPLGWENSDWLKVALISGAGVAFYWADQRVHDWLEENKTTTSSDISTVVSYFGHGGVILAGTGGGYLLGEITGSRQIRKVSLLSLESWLASGFIVTLMKFLIGRERPYVSHNSKKFHPFSLKSGHHSWPSGHASSAFAVAAVIAAEAESGLIDGAVYSLASLVALSRVHDGYHWLSDVFIGSVLGYVIGHKIARLHTSPNNQRVAWGIIISSQETAFTLKVFF